MKVHSLKHRRAYLFFILSLLVPLVIFGVQAHEGEKIGGGPNGQPGDAPMSAMSTTPCVNGMAGTFPCRNIDLVSFLPLSALGGLGGTENANDIWGWTDPQTGKEYAIIGLASGTSFVDISIPDQPIFLGKLPAHSVSSAWRGIKVYQNHAFIISEAAGHGMQVFNLTQLRNVTSPPVAFTETAHYNGFDRAHTLALNTDTGFAYAAGSQAGANTCGRSLHIVDVRNPATPTFAGCVLPIAPDTYTHETQCVTYHGPDTAYQGHEICFNANNAATSSGPAAVTIVDVTNKSNPVQLSRTTYQGSYFAHQGWLTEDHKHFLLDDELDETHFNHNSKTYIFDVSDLNAPVLKNTYSGPSTAIDHNLYIRGNYAYEGNYRSGLRILSLSNINAGTMTEEAFFDIFPLDDAPAFNGAWSNYPFFNSGLVIVGGIEQGLFVLRPSLGSATPTPTPTPTPGGTWTPTTLNASQVNIQTWRQSNGHSYAKVQLTFPNNGFRVQDQNWGIPPSGVLPLVGNQLTADALVEQSTPSAAPTTVTTAQIYDLGTLADGNYTFIFKTSGQTAKTVNFTVTSAAPPANPIDNQREFVRWQYKDFLGREPDQAGWDFWTDNITLCLDAARRPAGVSIEACIDRQRETTSAAFFLSPEFQYTGYFIYRIYKGGLGRAPYLSEFLRDQATVSQGIINSAGQLDAARINQNKQQFAQQFIQSLNFLPFTFLPNDLYVILLAQNTGTLTAADRQALIVALNAGTETRASVLFKIVDGINVISEGNQQFTTTYGQAFYNQQLKPAFVQMEYFGYLRRDPDNPGYQFWLGKLNSFPSYIEAQMVRSFIVSPEYRSRFGAP